MEEWRDIEGYKGLYQVSSYGRVKSLERDVISGRGGVQKRPEKIVKPMSSNGYYRILLHKDGKKKAFFVHRLVAETFLPNLDNLPQVNHKDEDKTNNCVDNLEWCTAKYNSNFGTRLERVSMAQVNHPYKSKKVLQFDLNGNLVKEWESTKECGRNGYDQSAVSHCCRNKPHYNTYKGYKWKYKNG